MVKVGGSKKTKDEADLGPMKEEKRQKKKSLDFVKSILAFAFSQVGVVVLCVMYAVGGARIYMSMEVPFEEEAYLAKQKEAKAIIAATDYLTNSFWDKIHNPNPDKRLNETAYYEKVGEDLHSLAAQIVSAAENLNYDGEVEGWNKDWFFPNALLFTITIMTTIGYGHISPQTDSGKLFTILYAMIGMPLFVMFLGGIGDTMANGFKYAYSRICCRWCRIKRLVSERIPGQSLRKAKKLRDEVLNEESYMPGTEISIPIILCVLAIVLYLIMGSAIFHVWEEWDLPSAAYFCFITLSTVGFGDMVPTRSFLGYEESLYGKFQMFVCVTYCAMGLAVLATAMSLIQEGLMIKAERMKKKMGLGRGELITIETITVRERAGRDGDGKFVGISCDEESPVGSLVGKPAAAVAENDDAAFVGTEEEEIN